jgi:hypothetical protein
MRAGAHDQGTSTALPSECVSSPRRNEANECINDPGNSTGGTCSINEARERPLRSYRGGISDVE